MATGLTRLGGRTALSYSCSPSSVLQGPGPKPAAPGDPWGTTPSVPPLKSSDPWASDSAPAPDPWSSAAARPKTSNAGDLQQRPDALCVASSRTASLHRNNEALRHSVFTPPSSHSHGCRPLPSVSVVSCLSVCVSLLQVALTCSVPPTVRPKRISPSLTACALPPLSSLVLTHVSVSVSVLFPPRCLEPHTWAALFVASSFELSNKC